ncbi:MAG: hypothetical protein ACI9OJ_001768, partial [Myxococcota bacterium]
MAGTLYVTVAKRPAGSHFVVRTPVAIVTVVGTVFETRHVDGVGTTVRTTEGLVKVTRLDGSDSVLVAAGESVTVRAQAPVEPMEERLAAAQSLIATGSVAQAIELLTPLTHDGAHRRRALTYLGDAHVAMGQHARAAAAWERALVLAPTSTSLTWHLVRLYDGLLALPGRAEHLVGGLADAGGARGVRRLGRRLLSK